MDKNKTISVKVCYASETMQDVIPVELPKDSSVKNAIQHSGLLDKYTEIDLSKNKIGIYAKVVGLDHTLINNDRVEVYRPLSVNPMQARRQRAEQQNS